MRDPRSPPTADRSSRSSQETGHSVPHERLQLPQRNPPSVLPKPSARLPLPTAHMPVGPIAIPIVGDRSRGIVATIVIAAG